ncbi:nitroreductase/quinone reductase family protein [Nocardia crassostreae]|uniref:nitroreductase/quinone reductase family protein n=1 Tax=Nocardia crassostreae TaxID=53428 RepID=UPI00082D8A5E|nr:nitroreductase/quinone reductase family protein [Nocardia crassostreae]
MHTPTLPDSDYHQFQRRVIAAFRSNGGRFAGTNLILLTTVGAKTGLRRTNPLACFEVAGHPAVVACGLGGARFPDWYHNIRANPEVTVEIGTDIYRAVATTAPDAERDSLLARIVELAPDFPTYLADPNQLVPVVTLKRAPFG